MTYYTILYYTILYYTILYYTIIITNYIYIEREGDNTYNFDSLNSQNVAAPPPSRPARPAAIGLRNLSLASVLPGQ